MSETTILVAYCAQPGKADITRRAIRALDEVGNLGHHAGKLH